MPMIDDATRLRHMRDAPVEAVGFIRDRTRADLEGDRMLTLALVKDIEIIGEAAGRSSTDCKVRYPHIPWMQMIGMRNRLGTSKQQIVPSRPIIGMSIWLPGDAGTIIFRQVP